MNQLDDGGNAFPHTQDGWTHSDRGGMSLRDYFAAKAMQAIVAKLPVVDREGEFGKPVPDKNKYNADIANSAYWIADAMIAERAKS